MEKIKLQNNNKNNSRSSRFINCRESEVSAALEEEEMTMMMKVFPPPQGHWCWSSGPITAVYPIRPNGASHLTATGADTSNDVCNEICCVCVCVCVRRSLQHFVFSPYLKTFSAKFDRGTEEMQEHFPLDGTSVISPGTQVSHTHSEVKASKWEGLCCHLVSKHGGARWSVWLNGPAADCTNL